MRISTLVFLGLAIFGCDNKRNDQTREGVRDTTEPAPGFGVPGTAPLSSGAPGLSPRRLDDEHADAPRDPLEAADKDMREVLQQFAALGGKSLATLTPEEARKQPTPADAVRKVLEARGKPTTPLEVANVLSKKIPGGPAQLDARIYTPKTDAEQPLPVVTYWHGGGFVIADLDTYDATARALAQKAEAIVVSLDYRHAPEAKFPAAHEDAWTGYDWVVKNAASFGGDPKRIALAGESAGGNLAANVAIQARDKGSQQPVHLLLIYPVAQASMDTPSYRKWTNARPLDKSMMGWFVNQYTNAPADVRDPRISLVNANLAGLPPTTIISAEIDPLSSDSEMLKEKLEAANVDVSQKTYEGVTHEFFGMAAVVEDAEDAQDWAANRLQRAFKNETEIGLRTKRDARPQ